MCDGGLCQCDRKILGLMSCAGIRLGFFSFLFSLTLPLQLSVQTSSSAAPCSMVLLPIPSKTITSVRAQSSLRTHIMRYPVWTGPTWGLCFTILCHVFYCFFFSNKHFIPHSPPILSVCPHVHVVIAVTW